MTKSMRARSASIAWRPARAAREKAPWRQRLRLPAGLPPCALRASEGRPLCVVAGFMGRACAEWVRGRGIRTCKNR